MEREEKWCFFKKVEQCGRWPQQASHLRLCHTMIRWLEALRAPEVSKWQHKSRIEWDATDGRNVGDERIVWGTLLEMERFNCHAGEK